MKKTIGTLITGITVLAVTAGAAIAGTSTFGEGSFPYFQFGCLLIGGLLITSLKAKYDKIYTSEAVGSFALYTVLISLFTSPVIEMVKNIVS